jgi:hypothetical protein
VSSSTYNSIQRITLVILTRIPVQFQYITDSTEGNFYQVNVIFEAEIYGFYSDMGRKLVQQKQHLVIVTRPRFLLKVTTTFFEQSSSDVPPVRA